MKYDHSEIPDPEKDFFVAGHIIGLHYGIHTEYPDRDCRYIIFLREPAAWHLSMYHQEMHRTKKNIPFPVWYENTRGSTVYPLNIHKNKMTVYVCQFFGVKTVEQAKHMLKKCWLVNLTENLDDVLPDLFIKLGVTTAYDNRRVTGTYDELDNGVIEKKYEMIQEMKEKIYADNVQDVELYRWVKENVHFWKWRDM